MGPLEYVDDPTDQTDPVQAAWWSLGCELSIVWLSCFLVFYKVGSAKDSNISSATCMYDRYVVSTDFL